jgi:hypothetical protein
MIHLAQHEALINNEFMDRLHNIKKSEQRELFIANYACKKWE